MTKRTTSATVTVELWLRPESADPLLIAASADSELWTATLETILAGLSPDELQNAAAVLFRKTLKLPEKGAGE